MLLAGNPKNVASFLADFPGEDTSVRAKTPWVAER
jgi:hypothetical protein